MPFNLRVSIVKPFVICCCLILGACANQQVAATKVIESVAAKKAEKRVVTPQEAIAVADEEMIRAEKENLRFFSPLHLTQAEQNLALAKTLLVKPKAGEPNAAIEAAISAIEFLKKGFTNKSDVQVYLKEAIAHKRLLQKLEVPERYPEAYGEVLFEFSKLIKIIEEGEPDVALNKQKPLRARMYELEIAALTDIHLSEAKKVLLQAEENDAERYAPASYFNAKYKIDSTEQYIQDNYRDRKGIEKAGKMSLLLAKVAHEVGIESKKIMNLDSPGSEAYVLAQVKRLQSFQDLLEAGELPPQSLERSSMAVKTALQNVLTDREQAKTEIASLKAELEKYNAVSINPLSEQIDSGVSVLQTLNTKDLGDAPALQDGEQGFDSVEYVGEE